MTSNNINFVFGDRICVINNPDPNVDNYDEYNNPDVTENNSILDFLWD